MTPAERMRRHRQAKREGTSLAPRFAAKAAAERAGRSERWHYYAAVVSRLGLPELQALLEPPHRLGVRTAAEIARSLNSIGQLMFIETVKTQGKSRALARRQRLAQLFG